MDQSRINASCFIRSPGRRLAKGTWAPRIAIVTVLGVDCCACVAIGHAGRAPEKRDEFPPLHCRALELSPSLSDLSVKVQAAGCPVWVILDRIVLSASCPV